MVQVPAVRKVAVVPLTVQAPVVCEANETGKPELAVATSVSGVPTVCVPTAAKLIVCAVPLCPEGWLAIVPEQPKAARTKNEEESTDALWQILVPSHDIDSPCNESCSATQSPIEQTIWLTRSIGRKET